MWNGICTLSCFSWDNYYLPINTVVVKIKQKADKKLTVEINILKLREKSDKFMQNKISTENPFFCVYGFQEIGIKTQMKVSSRFSSQWLLLWMNRFVLKWSSLQIQKRYVQVERDGWGSRFFFFVFIKINLIQLE